MALKEQDYEKYKQLVRKQVNLLQKLYNPQNIFLQKYNECYREVQDYFDPVHEKLIIEKLYIYANSGLEPILEQQFYV